MKELEEGYEFTKAQLAELKQLQQRVIDLEGSHARSVNLREHLAVCQQRVAESSEDSLRLIETIKYLVGIAEKGEGRELREHETIEQFVLGYVVKLEQRVAELEEQVDMQTPKTAFAELKKQLAANQLENKRLRSALAYVIDDLELRASLKLDEDERGVVDIGNGAYTQAKEALREPTDTEALESYIQEHIDNSELAEVSAIQIANLTSRLETLLIKYAALKEKGN